MLHDDVHETATAHMQSNLRLSCARLNVAVVGYWDPTALRATDIADHLRLTEARLAGGVQQMSGTHASIAQTGKAAPD